MAEDLALGWVERNRHVRRILVQVSTFRLLLFEKLQFDCGFSFRCFYIYVCTLIAELFSLCYIVDGSWSSWFVLTPCSVTCGTGVEILSRSCTNPAPKYGGKSCQGDAQKQQVCTKKPCPS